MKEIDDYLNRLYRPLHATGREIAELRKEMKAHLLETVQELEAEGNSPQESIRIAIERFGDPDQIGKELPKVMIVSRLRFFRLVAVLGSVALIIAIIAGTVIFDNIKKQAQLTEAESIRQSVMAELVQSQKTVASYDRIFDQIAALNTMYAQENMLSEALQARYNIAAINEIGEMKDTFVYHDGVLLGVAIIAAGTDYESPYFVQIAQLAVMKLSDSASVIELAEQVREAETELDKKAIEIEINTMQKTADFPTYEAALAYNRSLQEKK